MSRKLAVSALLLALILAVASDTLAASPPLKDDIIRFTRNPPQADLQSLPLEPGSLVSVQAGAPLASPGTFCTGDWMGSRYYRISGTFAGGEIYYCLQDPSLTLPYSWNAAGCILSDKFNVTAINMEINKRPANEGPNPFTFSLQPIVFDADLTNPGCPFPGAVKCAGPVYEVTLSGGSTGATVKVNLPFTIECCVDGPYFAALHLAGTWGTNVAQVTTDHYLADPSTWPTGYVQPPPPPQICHDYIYGDGPPWGIYDWVAAWAGPYNLRLYSEGYTPNDWATQCTPGICGWQWWYGVGRDVADPGTDPDLLAYTLPNTTGTRQKIAVRFPSVGLDTLKQIAFMASTYAGAPDIVVEVFGSSVWGSSCGLFTEPGSLLFADTIPNASLVAPPLANNVPIPDIVWGVLNGGPPKDIFVSLSVAGGLPNRLALYARTKAHGTCTEDPHTMFNVSGSWIYGGDYSGDDDEAYIDAYICKEITSPPPPGCPFPGPDNWKTWAHDFRRTSATSVSLGDPCKVREQWSQFLPHISSFTNPVVAGGKVYVASDYEVNSYDLATSVPGNKVNTFPYTGSQVRCNVSVERNRVFITGGTSLSISCWDSTLTTVFWSNDLTGPSLSLTANGPLATRNRFGATVVYRVLSDTVVAVGTEMPGMSGNGWLYALDAKTGHLYSGWATNPVMLDRGSMCSPSYDGTNLYVGTAMYGTVGDGSLYSFNATTGVQNWNYKDAAAPDEGWPGGVSVEGDFLYAATYYNDATLGMSSGHRYGIYKSGPSPVIAWRYLQGPCLYAAPTIGTSWLYIPQDDPSAGVLMIDKAFGKAAYNWSANGVGSVPQNVTLTCDRYLFAGDRLGYWYLLNAYDQSMEWRREFTGIVNGTAIAYHAVTGHDYAVVSARSSKTGPANAGVLATWRFDQQSRPFLRQSVYSTEIQIPLNSGPGLGPHVEPGVFANNGCVNLTFGTPIIHDPWPTAEAFTEIQQKYAAAYVSRKIGSDYVTYFASRAPSKRDRLAGAGVRADEELTAFDKARDNAYQVLSTKGALGATAAGATTDILRTSNVTYSANPLLPGATTNVSWMYDGSGLGRGTDDEYIQAVDNDPDFYPEDLTYSILGYPALLVHYVGGCPEQYTTLTWNTLGAPNSEKVWNHGALGDVYAGALVWGTDAGYNGNLCDGGFLLVGDSSAALSGAQIAIDYGGFKRLYRPEPRPSDGNCGFEAGSNIHLGYRRQGGCPGRPIEVLGAWVRAVYSDTNEMYPPESPLSSMGVGVAQTEIGAYDPMYGDFKLIAWKVVNRDAIAKNLRAGSYIDWDVADSLARNVGFLSDNFNGYAIWDGSTPRYAYGMLDPAQPASYCGVNPSVNSPSKIAVTSNNLVYSHTPGNWYNGTTPADFGYGWALASRPPYRQYDNGPQGSAGTKEDRGGWLLNAGFTLSAGGSATIVQALYAVPATSNDVATIEALGIEVAKRAARWAGFARGDVNDDGCVDLADVCWLQSGNQIYPDTYCGDVNNDGVVTSDDWQYLLNYVSAIGPAPQGSWRFTF